MRRILIALVAAACSKGTHAPTPSATHTVAVNASRDATKERVLALFTRQGIPIVSTDASVITTGPVDRLDLRSGGLTANVEYFIRATVVGDSPATVTLTPWSRANAPNKPATEQPVPTECSGTTKCRRLHTRLAALTDSLRS